MMKHLLLGFVLVLGLCTTGFSQNLILNPGNDEPLVNGEIPGWQEVVGTNWTQRCSDPTAYDGSCYFYAEAGAVGKLEQTIDLAAYANHIDNGVQDFYFSGYVRSWSQQPADESQIELRFLSEAGDELSADTLGPYAEINSWLLAEATMNAPVGARSIRITLHSIRHSGTNNDGYFDALSLVANEVPIECTLEVIMTQEGEVVTVEAAGTGAISGIYTINWGDDSSVENNNVASHTYEPGEYTLCVTYFDVSPPMGSASGTQGCFVEECFDIIIEELSIKCSVELTLVQNGNVVTATASGDGLTEEIYFINWGDGSLTTEASSGTHTYPEDGVYEICVTYQDDEIKPTCSATACEDVNIVTIGLDESNKNIAHLSVYPNPIESNSQIVFSLKQASNVVIDIVDVLGKSVQHIASSSYGQGTQRVNWNSQALESGIYFVRVIANDEGTFFKVVK